MSNVNYDNTPYLKQENYNNKYNLKPYYEDPYLIKSNLFEYEKRFFSDDLNEDEVSVYTNKPNSFFLRVYRRNLDLKDHDSVDSEILARMASLFPKIIDYLYKNMKLYRAYRTDAQKFFAVGILEKRFKSTREKFRTTKDNITMQVVKEFLISKKIVKMKDRDLHEIINDVRFNLIEAKSNYNTAADRFNNIMKIDLPDLPNFDAIKASKLQDFYNNPFGFNEIKSIKDYISLEFAVKVSSVLLKKVPVFGSIISKLDQLNDARKKVIEEAKEEYKTRLKKYEKDKQKLFLSDFIDNVLKSGTEQYNRMVIEFMISLEKSYTDQISEIKVESKKDILTQMYIEMFYDLLAKSISFNKPSLLYELDFYISWIEYAGNTPSECALQIAIDDPKVSNGFVTVNPRVFILGLFSRNAAKGLNKVLKEINSTIGYKNVLDLDILKRVYYGTFTHSDKDFRYVLQLSRSFYMTKKNYIYYPKYNELNNIQKRQFHWLLGPEMIEQLKENDPQKIFKSVEMDWHDYIRNNVTIVEDERRLFN
jgi:hypothetical protein